MIWFYAYLAIGAAAALISCFTSPAQKAPMIEVVIVVLVFVLCWPLCFIGCLKGLTKDADGNR